MVALPVSRGWRVLIVFYRLGDGGGIIISVDNPSDVSLCWHLCIGLLLLEHKYILQSLILSMFYFFKSIHSFARYL